MRYCRFAACLCLLLAGCSAIPDVVHQPQFHNPFPQLSRVAVLPFYNQSAEPTVDQDVVAEKYYLELQQIPGFEVVPVGVTKGMLAASGIDPKTPEDFQKLAQEMDVDAVVVGSVTEFSPYYPPRMGISVRWYAANPCFHPIPPGYGLPWGTAGEEFIPESLVWEAEFALAKEQLKTQTPAYPAASINQVEQRKQTSARDVLEGEADRSDGAGPSTPSSVLTGSNVPVAAPLGPDLPPDWPDPRGFVPPPPSPERPECTPQHEPLISLTRLYDGHDAEFTTRLANYFYFRDDARFGGWQAYLQRSDDFIRFCCHLHITEMLAARGGAGKTRVVWRWPISRYER